ncbi:hypothetical protein DEU56DRAFT_904600 [Suillus clintonianus]|uniref:uncharacterized protein n=1 Tax=Suillus clintonianus TaxID=1904413 RepID=UPI001B85B381|nr:uncharacterized protein DEU56DRAFT_904600 [Suillus clintonianus]KAG2121752.1 hypothetical protein DEU56DRAFT_904600 [Suillus clintonianus]
MATKFEAFDDSASTVSNPPPSYDATSASAPADSVLQKRRATVLSRIREIVSSPNFDPSSAGSIVNSCAANLSAAEFSKLLQRPNIEDHTALYWAIVNNRREALWAFIKFISKFSPACSSELRLACMAVNDHVLFTQLNLSSSMSPKEESLRRFLGCPPDDIEVKALGDNCFIASFRFRMFQKRLRTAQELSAEFVAGRRIWVLRFFLGQEGVWQVEYRLSEHSLPLHPDVSLQIEAHRKSPDCVVPKPLVLDLQFPSDLLVPKGSPWLYTNDEFCEKITVIWQRLGEWLMDDHSVYVNCHGILIMTMKIKLK